jgi:hypothetical protein
MASCKCAPKKHKMAAGIILGVGLLLSISLWVTAFAIAKPGEVTRSRSGYGYSYNLTGGAGACAAFASIGTLMFWIGVFMFCCRCCEEREDNNKSTIVVVNNNQSSNSSGSSVQPYGQQNYQQPQAYGQPVVGQPYGQPVVGQPYNAAAC